MQLSKTATLILTAGIATLCQAHNVVPHGRRMPTDSLEGAKENVEKKLEDIITKILEEKVPDSIPLPIADGEALVITTDRMNMTSVFNGTTLLTGTGWIVDVEIDDLGFDTTGTANVTMIQPVLMVEEVSTEMVYSGWLRKRTFEYKSPADIELESASVLMNLKAEVKMKGLTPKVESACVDIIDMSFGDAEMNTPLPEFMENPFEKVIDRLLSEDSRVVDKMVESVDKIIAEQGYSCDSQPDETVVVSF